MKKVIVLLLVCFMALGASLAMADTRTDSLGLTAGQQVDDLDSIWMFPQDAGNFGNVVDFRLGNPNGNVDDDWGGVIHKDFEEVGYIGIYYNRPFNDYYISPNRHSANSFGILNGGTNWANQILPGNYGSQGTSAGGNFYGATFSTFPWAFNADMNNFVDFEWNQLNSEEIADPQNKLDLFWSKDFADVVVGARFNYASQSGQDNNGFGNGSVNIIYLGSPVGDENGKYTSDSSVLGLDLGLTLKEIAPDTSLALGAGYSLGSVNYLENYSTDYVTAGSQTVFINSTVKDDNISEIRVNALLKNKMNETTTGRIYANARIDSLGFKQVGQYDTDGDGTFSSQDRETFNGSSAYTDTNINLGIACDHSVAEGKAKVIASVGAIYDARKWTFTAFTNLAGSATTNQIRRGSGDTVNEDWLAVPFNVAIEAPLFDWLTARMGANYDLFHTINTKVVAHHTINAAGTAFEETDTANNSYDWYQNINLTYGLSVKSGNWTLDLQVDPDQLLSAAQAFEPGSGILYGSDNNQTNSQVSGPAQIFATFIQADLRFAF